MSRFVCGPCEHHGSMLMWRFSLMNYLADADDDDNDNDDAAAH